MLANQKQAKRKWIIGQSFLYPFHFESNKSCFFLSPYPFAHIKIGVALWIY